MVSKTVFVLIALLASAPPVAQHESHQSPYAHQEQSGIAALSAEELQDLRDGAGMGLARAAELNHYPGPKHVLELAPELGLTPDQRTRVEGVHAEMLAAAQRLGEEIIQAEESLDRLFSRQEIDEASLDELTAEVARLRGELRFAHLLAHLETRSLLASDQIERYDELRGYGSGARHEDPVRPPG